MTAPRLLVPADDDWIGRIHEQHLIRHIVAIHIVKSVDERIEELAAARIDNEHHFADMAACMLAEFDKFRDEDRRQIVDDEIAQILHIAAGLCLAAARHARDDDEPRCGLLLFLLALSRFLRAAARHRLRQFLLLVHSRHLLARFQQLPFHFSLYHIGKIPDEPGVPAKHACLAGCCAFRRARAAR